MRPVEDKGCYNHEPIKPHRGSHHRTALGKPTPSKWDDAQKWIVGFSKGGEKNQSKTAPRNSNADDLRLIAYVPQKEQDYSSNDEEEQQQNANQFEAETKNVDCRDSILRIEKQIENPAAAVRSICVRDTGTEMTPIASQEPSRTATPIRGTTATATARSPISSGSLTPAMFDRAKQGTERFQPRIQGNDVGVESNTIQSGEESNGGRVSEENRDSDQAKKMNSLETRAMAWDEAERAKYMARFKREEVKIEAWENKEKRKAETEMRKIEVKAERMKSRAQEKMAKKLARATRMAEERRANAEAKLNEKAVKTWEKSDYVKRTGHLPSSFSFKLPSICW
ncbi:remorin-like [Cucurbita moschata]|uniref:Remorin-like n=1 Tax=Cucurbita moschata TaxID=3662 RepID=A0A6J1FZB7_CUCMO|nr:remorin-like [Cucurbita moschata]